MARKITSPADLKALRDQAVAEIDLRGGVKDLCVTVHMGTCGIAAGAREVLTALMEELSQQSVDHVTIRQAGCAGLCDMEPMVSLAEKSGGLYRYGKLDRKKIRQIAQEHVLRGKPVTEFLIKT
jgi:(2Fe-2S) ferredoxin